MLLNFDEWAKIRLFIETELSFYLVKELFVPLNNIEGLIRVTLHFLSDQPLLGLP